VIGYDQFGLKPKNRTEIEKTEPTFFSYQTVFNVAKKYQFFKVKIGNRFVFFIYLVLYFVWLERKPVLKNELALVTSNALGEITRSKLFSER